MSFHLFQSGESIHIPGLKEQTVSKPAVAFSPDRVYIPAVDRGRPLDHALKAGDAVLKGTILGTKGPDQFPVYSSVSGKILSVEPVLTALGFNQDCFVIENDHKDAWVETKAALKPVEEASKEEILTAMKESGVVGFGGAGFPTYRKFNSGKPVDVLIVNAIECEPYLTTDYVYGASQLEWAFKAFPYLLKVTGAKKVVYCTKKDKPALIEAFNTLKAKYPDLPLELKLAKDAYPMGYERNLVTLVTKREYQNIPIEAGAIVDNIYTFISLGRYFVEGKVPTERCITVAGEVKEPKNVLTPYGVMAKDLIAFCGGETVEEGRYVNGGPLNGNALESSAYVTLLPTNGVLVLKAKSYRAEPCWHCGACAENCPMDLQPVQIQMALKRGDLKRMIELDADRCCSCHLCSYVCPSRIEVTTNVLSAKQQVIAYKKSQASGEVKK